MVHTCTDVYELAERAAALQSLCLLSCNHASHVLPPAQSMACSCRLLTRPKPSAALHDSACLQACKSRKGEDCEQCPYCLCLPCLSLLRKVSNHLNLVKGGALLHPQGLARQRSRAWCLTGLCSSVVA